ncbi:MAG: ATP-binding protein [Xenococcaceae cyanobacterium MO_188.B29]|nr:ATP-binding protein [Xenococcaceae cyanobacterium MO_188.B29]
MSNPSSLILKRTVSSKTFEELRSLWSATAKLTGQEILLVTDASLSSLATKDWKPEKFSILISFIFNALLIGKEEKNKAYHQVQISFDTQVITDYLTSLNQIGDNYSSLDKNLQSYLSHRTPSHSDYLNEFIQQIINILTPEQNQEYNSLLVAQPLKNILHYQAEQQRILNQVEIQINQHLDLLEIVQMTIEQVRILLELDRLVIYQIGVPISSTNSNNIFTQLFDTVTYESRASDDIPSILYFHDEVCFSRSTQCRDKYRQGFSLAINDIEQETNFSACLKSLMRKLNIKAKLVTPIIVQNELWGFLIAHQCFAPRQWNNTQIRFMEQIAEYLAIAIYQNKSYQQLQQQKEKLEQQVKTRAEQLKDALIAAQAANQSKHEFIGSMSHELRTPLTCVIGLSGTLLHWSLASDRVTLPLEKQQQYLKTIHDSGKHLLSLINNILEFSEVESGKFLLNVTEFSLQSLARNVLQILQEESHKQQVNLSLDFKVDPEEDKFCADRQRVQEILLNLLSNGIKFTPVGGQVILRIWRENNQVIFEVEDTGIGISQQQLPMLFESFQQLESSLQRTYGGTGLGLALTKQLIELHGGTIEVESAVGEGSIFTVCLPSQAILKPKYKQSIKEASNHQQTIILVSQEEEKSTIICQLLNAAEYQVVWLVDPSTAIDKIKLLAPKLVILDRDLPELDIINFSESLQELRATQKIQLVLLVLQITPEEWQYFSSIGMDDYLLKSIPPHNLLEKIDTLIEKSA